VRRALSFIFAAAAAVINRVPFVRRGDDNDVRKIEIQ